MFHVGGLGTMQGQANVFHRYTEERIPYAIDRYQRETRRLYEVLEARLRDRAFLIDDYSIADIALYAYTHVAGEAGLELDDYAAVGAWLQRVAGQPGHIPITHVCPFLDP